MDKNAGIHPAPAEFTDAQIAADPILHFFHYKHLPAHLAATSVKFFYLAVFLVMNLPRNAERTVALRKLLEAKDAAVRAKDAAVRANLPMPQAKPQQVIPAGSIQAGEAREIGGHDEDRDGPIPFDN